MKKVILPFVIAVFAIIPSKSFAQSNEILIKDYIYQNKLKDYKKSDLNNFIIDNVDASKSLNGNVVKFQQTYKGYPIYSSGGTALVKESKVTYLTDNFVKDYSASYNSTAGISKKDALQKIATTLGKEEISNFSILEYSDRELDNKKFAKQRLVYVLDDNNLKFAYEFSFREPKSPNYWNILVDAQLGLIIRKENLNLSCNFHPGAYNHDHSTETFIGPVRDYNSNYFSLLLPDNASYNVFALPIEAPTFGTRSLISNP